MLRADLQQGDSADQREGPAGEGAALVPLQDPDVVRDGDTYYLVINNLGERCVLFFYHSKRPVAKLYLVYYNQWAVAGTDTRLYPRSRPALPDPV